MRQFVRNITLTGLMTLVGLAGASTFAQGSPKGFDKGEKKGWQGAETPPGWSQGEKKGWSTNAPPGWTKGEKKGWEGRESVPESTEKPLKEKTVPPGRSR